MKIAIRSPCPADPNDQVFWGDFYFTNALCKSFSRLQVETEIQYWPEWHNKSGADALLVLRGIRKIEEKASGFDTTAVWIISHPEDIEERELECFDVVFCGSNSHAKQLKKRGFNAHALLQCTESDVFYPEKRNRENLANAFIFVGNTRGAHRKTIESAVDRQLPLKIWGRGWGGEKYQKYLVGDYIHNSQLGDLYRSSYCCFSDHWADMRALKYINNRIFDSLACALPIISEPHAGYEELGLGGIRVITPDENFDHAIDEFIVSYDRYQAEAQESAKLIHEKHTFDNRASQIMTVFRG